MQQRYFYVPFAKNGTITEIPMATDPTGLVSYNIGWGTDYELPLATNPAAKAVDAPSSNGILYDITYALQDLQQYGTPEFIDATDNQGTAFTYDIYAMCRYSSTGTAPFTPFMSRVTNNTTTPAEGTNWSRVGNLNDINATVAAEATLRASADTTLATAISAETTRATAAENTKASLNGNASQPFSASNLTAPVVGGAATYLSLTATTFTQSANLAVTALVPHWCAPAPNGTPNAAVTLGQLVRYGGSSNSATSGTSLSTTVSFTAPFNCLILVNGNCGNGAAITNIFMSTISGATSLDHSQNYGGGGASSANCGVYTGTFSAASGASVILTLMMSCSTSVTQSIGFNYILVPIP